MDRVPGAGPAEVIVTRRVALRTTICLDLLYGGELSEDAGTVGLLVNQSNLVALPGDRMREQFLAIARTRALEQHKPLLLVSNDGPTAVIDADGRVLARLPFGVAGALSHDVRPQLGRTPYAMLGDITWLLPLTIAALVLALRRPRPTG